MSATPFPQLADANILEVGCAGATIHIDRFGWVKDTFNRVIFNPKHWKQVPASALGLENYQWCETELEPLTDLAREFLAELNG